MAKRTSNKTNPMLKLKVKLEKAEEEILELSSKIKVANGAVKIYQQEKVKLVAELAKAKALPDQILYMSNVHDVYENDTACLDAVREAIGRI